MYRQQGDLMKLFFFQTKENGPNVRRHAEGVRKHGSKKSMKSFRKKEADKLTKQGRTKSVETRRVVSSWMLHRVALVRTDVSEELSTSFTRVTRISELGTTLKSYLLKHVRFEVFAAVTMKNAVFWDVTPRGSCNKRSFRGT
jgi:hypothetical protein